MASVTTFEVGGVTVVPRDVDTAQGCGDITEDDAVKPLDSIECRLVVEETLTQQLLKRCGLVA